MKKTEDLSKELDSSIFTNSEEVQAEYNFSLSATMFNDYNAVVLAVSYEEYKKIRKIF